MISVHHLYNNNQTGGARWNVRVDQRLDGNSLLGLNVTDNGLVGFSWIDVKEKQTGKMAHYNNDSTYLIFN